MEKESFWKKLKIVLKEPKNLVKLIVLLFCLLLFVVAMIIKGCNININNNKLSIIETIALTISCSLYFVISFSLNVSITHSFNNIVNNFYTGSIPSDSPLANAYRASHYIYVVANKILIDLNKSCFDSKSLSIDDINRFLNAMLEKRNFIVEELCVYGSGKKFQGKEKDCFLFLQEFCSNVGGINNYVPYSATRKYQDELSQILMYIITKYDGKKVAPLEE